LIHGFVEGASVPLTGRIATPSEQKPHPEGDSEGRKRIFANLIENALLFEHSPGPAGRARDLFARLLRDFTDFILQCLRTIPDLIASLTETIDRPLLNSPILSGRRGRDSRVPGPTVYAQIRVYLSRTEVSVAELIGAIASATDAARFADVIAVMEV
jgi:hypothetical protein